MWAGYKGDRHSHFTNCVNETSLHHFLSGRNMAAAAPVQKEETTCSICLEYFTEPVSLESECGHGFCLSCITRYSEGLQTDFPCPQCREISQSKTLRPNRHLANVVGISKQLEVQSATPQEANLSREHEEELKLFCADDQKPICVVSSMSRDHKPLPIREAAQEYKEKFQNYLDRLKIKLKDILELHRNEETKVTELEAKFKSQREQITKEFEKLQKFLEKEKSRHLSNLEEEEKKSLQSIKETVTKLEEQQFVLRSWITEIELKCQQQDVELLKDAKTVLSRYENMKDQQTDFYTMAGNKEEAEDEEVEKEVDLQRMIIESLEWRRDRRFAAEVTLDPDTAHRRLILSEDGRSVRRGDRALDLPDTPQRFTKYSIVLGRERLSSGRHYWEVEVGDKTGWTLGVCDESVSRKGEITGSPEDGYWTVGLFDGVYVGLTDPSSILSPRVPPRVVGLFMDYEEERLSVYDVDDRSMLFTYCGDFFPHTLRPYFYPGRSDGGRNAGALRILPGTGRE